MGVIMEGRGCDVIGEFGQSPVGGASQVTLLLELFVQDVPVLVKAAIDAPDLPTFTHPQFPAHQPDKPLVV